MPFCVVTIVLVFQSKKSEGNFYFPCPQIVFETGYKTWVFLKPEMNDSLFFQVFLQGWKEVCKSLLQRLRSRCQVLAQMGCGTLCLNLSNSESKKLIVAHSMTKRLKHQKKFLAFACFI